MSISKPANMPEDAEAQLLLDAYLRGLQDGTAPDRKELLATRPELESLVACLERLEQLAPRPQPAADPNATQLSGPLAEMGRRVGKYEIARELGRGGMGVVYLARDTELGRHVALKMILTGNLADPEDQRRFQNEVRSAARVDHEGIVRVYDTGMFNGLTCLAMQYVDGPTLAQVINEQRPDRETAVRCVIQLARTVAYLHAQGVVHRDLKPSNVLLEMRNENQMRNAKITDFGLAKMLDESSALTCSNAVIGTPSYMAPEQARGESSSVGPAADVYALGAILYELLAGRPPFTGSTTLEVLLQVMSNEPVSLRRFDPEIPSDLEYICLKCLEKSPAQRFGSANELADALERHMKGEEPASPSLTLWHRVRRWALRSPALAARIGILAIVGVALLVRAIFTGRYNFVPGPVQGRLPAVLSAIGWLPLLLTILGAWIGLSALCQRLLRGERYHRLVPFVWTSSEVLILTVLLLVTGSLSSPLDVGYPLLIAGAGLWLRERLVWFTTACAAAGYIGATAIYFLVGAGEQFHRHVIFLIALVVTGYVVSYQVRRFRMLSRFYEGRSLD